MTDFPGCPVVKTLLSNAGAVSSIPGWGSKIPHVMQGSQKKKETTTQKFRTRNILGERSFSTSVCKLFLKETCAHAL